MAKDFYVVLGVAQNSTEKQIRERFLELARERHPDRVRGSDKAKAEEEFQEITEAFNVLTDRERRRQLDVELSRPSLAQQGSSEEAARVYLMRGVESFRAGDLSQAIENLERATREDPNSAKAWYNLGLANQKRPGGKGRAREALAKACELEPMNAKYLKETAVAFDNGAMYAEAAKFYKEALDWGGEDPETRAAFESALALAKSVG
jgi:DnaJ-class molecular chaperone